MKFGLRLKFVTITIVSVVVIFGFFLSFFTSQQRRLLTEELLDRGRILAQNLAYDLEYGILIKGEALLRQLVRNVGEQKDIAYVEIIDEKGACCQVIRKRGCDF